MRMDVCVCLYGGNLWVARVDLGLVDLGAVVEGLERRRAFVRRVFLRRDFLTALAWIVGRQTFGLVFEVDLFGIGTTGY